MRPLVLLSALVLLALPLSAQLHVDAGFALGFQDYPYDAKSQKPLVGAEALLRKGRFGVHGAFEYFSLSGAGGSYATHVDLVYRHPIDARWSFLAGAGGTQVTVGDYGNQVTWNAELEVARRFGRHTDGFLRVRQYDYYQEGFRDRVSPESPAVYLGFRMAFRD